MKANFLKFGLYTTMLVVVLFVVSACGGKGASEEQAKGKEYTSAYVCPMHCEGSGSDAEGVCPVCKMDYVANTEHSEEVHEH
jgi:DnaJ-class molecular chaperone